jgi:hypothetical protein
MALFDDLCGHHPAVLAGLAFLFSVGFLLQILVISPILYELPDRYLRVGSIVCGILCLWQFVVCSCIYRSNSVIYGPHQFCCIMCQLGVGSISLINLRDFNHIIYAYCCFFRDVLCTITGGRCSLVRFLPFSCSDVHLSISGACAIS